MTEAFDIVVIGAGPTGLMFAACMLRLGSYKIKHIEHRAVPTRTGRADGIQPRTLDILQNLGLKRRIMSQNPGRIYETAFWSSSKENEGSIKRTGTWKSFPESIDTRYPFSTILHQGRIESAFVDDLSERGLNVDRLWTIKNFHYDSKDLHYPIEVQLAHVHGTHHSTIRAKYIFAADGAKSTVREKLGIEMVERSPSKQIWSVIDGVVRTDFPDIHIKCTVQSSNGSAMIIPHGQNITRIYVQMFSPPGERPDALATVAEIKEAAQRVLQPYWIEWEMVDWHSSYHIGQAVANKYSLKERVFIGGDACHTHSPKSGQGMNYGLADAHNLAWKLHLVESGFLRRDILQTYEEERQSVANTLIDFDTAYADLFGELPADTDQQKTCNRETRRLEFIRKHKAALALTSGYGVSYPDNLLNWGPGVSASSQHSVFNPLESKLKPGYVFPYATATRVIDARVTYLEQDIPFNGSYRIYIFAGNPIRTRKAIFDLAQGIRELSVFSRFQHPAVDTSFDGRHNPHSAFYSFCVIINAPRATIDPSTAIPEFFSHYRHHVYADDQLYGKYASAKGSVHAKMGFDSQLGGLVVVRPDGYVGCTLSLEEGDSTSQGLGDYFKEAVGATIHRTDAITAAQL